MEKKINNAIQPLPDPHQLFQELGHDPTAIHRVETLSKRHGHALWRMILPEQSYILKWQPFADARIEIESYLMLQSLGVPTLPVYGYTSQALLLEDLAQSESWRLALETDMAWPATGRAAARWYKLFHQAGEELLSQGDYPSFLTRETDVLDLSSLLNAGHTLSLDTYPVWDLAVLQIDLLKAAVAKLSFTLNYNDFHWTNLALSRNEREQLDAIIFDYHLLGVGMRYSDCRNVTGSLSGAAVPAFWNTYGDIDPREQVLDQPLAHLYALTIASQMPKIPSWAEESRTRLVNGTLKKDLLAAIELSHQICSGKLL